MQNTRLTSSAEFSRYSARHASFNSKVNFRHSNLHNTV